MNESGGYVPSTYNDEPGIDRERLAKDLKQQVQAVYEQDKETNTGIMIPENIVKGSKDYYNGVNAAIGDGSRIQGTKAYLDKKAKVEKEVIDSLANQK